MENFIILMGFFYFFEKKKFKHFSIFIFKNLLDFKFYENRSIFLKSFEDSINFK